MYGTEMYHKTPYFGSCSGATCLLVDHEAYRLILFYFDNTSLKFLHVPQPAVGELI
jgi:hypothetical protein